MRYFFYHTCANCGLYTKRRDKIRKRHWRAKLFWCIDHGECRARLSAYQGRRNWTVGQR